LLVKTDIPFIVYSRKDNKLKRPVINIPDIQTLRLGIDINLFLSDSVSQTYIDKQVLIFHNDMKTNINYPKVISNFILELCMIRFDIEMLGEEDPVNPTARLPNTAIGHGIVGYKCNGIYKIYDSGLNYIENIDWSNLSDPNVELQMNSILDKYWITQKYPKHVKTSNILVTSALYVNSATIDKYSYTGTC
jgi:hypothetical protein